MPFRFLTAGESHGQVLTAIVEGLPAGIPLNLDLVNQELFLRQQGFGRSARMKIEKDSAQILSGMKNNKTLGSPITLLIHNKDQKLLENLPVLKNPRPGHADLVGTLKFKHNDIRNTLERASARETAIRTAVGALCQQFLNHFDIEFLSFTTQIGQIVLPLVSDPWKKRNTIEKSSLLCPDPKTEKKMVHFIELSQKKGETVGGTFEIRAKGLPLGLGNFIQWDLKLNARLAFAIMSIPAIKGVEIGEGFNVAKIPGSKAHDSIFYDSAHKKKFGFYRKTNRSGGIEGGVSTGEELILRAVMKPLSTLPPKIKNTITLSTKEKSFAISPRTDTCAVASASVVAKNVCAIEITKAFLEKFGGDSLIEVQKNYENYLQK